MQVSSNRHSEWSDFVISLAHTVDRLLELSGIGNSTILQQFGINTLVRFTEMTVTKTKSIKVDLPGVGENLMDHAMSAQMWQVNPDIVTWDALRINTTFAQQAAQQYNTTHDGVLASTINTLAFSSFQTVAGNDTAYGELLNTLDQWINSTSLTPLQSKQYEIQRRWLNASIPGMEFVMIPSGGLTRTRPANDTSYMIISAILQHPFSRGNVVRVCTYLRHRHPNSF